LHDWSSHGADAFRYLSLVVKTQQKLGVVVQSEKKRIDDVFKPKGYTLDELGAEYDERHKKTGFLAMRIG
jgi:hypothetical protein